MDSTNVEIPKNDEIEASEKNASGEDEFFEDVNGDFDGNNFSPSRGGMFR